MNETVSNNQQSGHSSSGPQSTTSTQPVSSDQDEPGIWKQSEDYITTVPTGITKEEQPAFHHITPIATADTSNSSYDDKQAYTGQHQDEGKEGTSELNREHSHEPLNNNNDIPASANALSKLRGRLMMATDHLNVTAGSTVRSASAPNLRRARTDADLVLASSSGVQYENGAVKRNNTTKSGNVAAAGGLEAASPGAPAARPPLISMQLLEPTRPVGKPPGFRASAIATMRFSWLNVLLVAVPVSWALNFSNQNSTAVFVASFLAIIPCAALLGFATEELALRVGDALGGLLNATFGNAVELIIAIIALVKGDLRVVQSAMLGSILSNCLLVLGMCYFAGGLRFHEQGYGVRAAQVNINLLGLSIFPIVILVGYHLFVEASDTQSLATTDSDIRNLSHGIAILLLLVYVAYLTFQLWTHAYLYAPPARGPDGQPIIVTPLAAPDGPQPPTEGRVFRIPSLPSWGGTSDTSSIRSTISRNDQDLESQAGRSIGRTASLASTSSTDSDPFHNIPKLSVKFSLALLLAVTGLAAVTAEGLVGSIEGLVESTSVQREFVALILLPIAGNVSEHLTAVIVARRNKLDLSMAVAVGSSIQIALFVIPFLVLLGWCIGQPLTLFFDPFEVVVLFISVVAVNWAIADGKTNWLEGFSLMMAWCIIAVVFFYYPGLSEVA